jgi:hypothetical protein
MGPAGLALRRSSVPQDREDQDHTLTLETNSGAGELYDLANDPHTEYVWPAPSASSFSDLVLPVCINVSGLWA